MANPKGKDYFKALQRYSIKGAENAILICIHRSFSFTKCKNLNYGI